MELVFDDRGSLLPGVHDVSMDDVKAYFGRFQRTDRRPTLFAKLVDYVDALRRAGIGGSVILDGSFVMTCVDEPNDVDVILVATPDWDMTAELKPYQYNLVSARAVSRAFGFDFVTVAASSPEEAKWIDFYGNVRTKWCERFGWPNGTRKGILRVVL